MSKTRLVERLRAKKRMLEQYLRTLQTKKDDAASKKA